jgi:hypothetical protein
MRLARKPEAELSKVCIRIERLHTDVAALPRLAELSVVGLDDPLFMGIPTTSTSAVTWPNDGNYPPPSIRSIADWVVTTRRASSPAQSLTFGGTSRQVFRHPRHQQSGSGMSSSVKACRPGLFTHGEAMQQDHFHSPVEILRRIRPGNIRPGIFDESIPPEIFPRDTPPDATEAGPHRDRPRLAEGVGFEPTVDFSTHAFQACRFGRSRILPVVLRKILRLNLFHSPD